MGALDVSLSFHSLPWAEQMNTARTPAAAKNRSSHNNNSSDNSNICRRHRTSISSSGSVAAPPRLRLAPVPPVLPRRPLSKGNKREILADIAERIPVELMRQYFNYPLRSAAEVCVGVCDGVFCCSSSHSSMYAFWRKS